MNTEIIKITDLQRDASKIELAADILKNGGLVALPTETVYGLAANALDSAAVSKIFEVKGRPQDNPLIVHVLRIADILPLTEDFPSEAEILAERFWPGPLTVILKKSGKIPEEVSAGLPTVAIRVPSHPVIRAVIEKSGLPLAAPSANLSGRPSPTSARHCVEDLNGRVDLILDGGDCTVGLESTVISLATTPPRLLRPGAVTIEALREALGEVAVDEAVTREIKKNALVSSPGMKYRHYAPNAEITLVHGDFESFKRYVEARPEAAALLFDGEDSLIKNPSVTYGGINNPQEQAARLFSALRRLDTLGAKSVFARAPEKSGVGLAVYNRLVRACAFNEVFL